jgi:hypothetical protein
MSTATNVRKTQLESDILTMEKIKAALKLLPPPGTPQIFVINQRTSDALNQHASPNAHLDPISKFTGIPIHCKPNQRVNCWAFSDPKLAHRYINDEITEKDLVNILAGVASQELTPP